MTLPSLIALVEKSVWSRIMAAYMKLVGDVRGRSCWRSEKVGSIASGIGMGSRRIPGRPARAFGFFFLLLHSMNSTMSGWSTLRMTILAARRVLPSGLDDNAGEGVEALHEAERAAMAVPPAVPGRPRWRSAAERDLSPVPLPHL